MSKHIALLAACVALVGGVAWALESQTIALPSGVSGIDAVLVPGAEGGAVFKGEEGWFEEVEYRIGFDPDGTVTVNGQFAGTTDVSHMHSVHIDIVETPTGYEASATVTDEDLQLVVCSTSGVDIGVDAPRAASAEGESVLSLTAE